MSNFISGFTIIVIILTLNETLINSSIETLLFLFLIAPSFSFLSFGVNNFERTKFITSCFFSSVHSFCMSTMGVLFLAAKIPT